MDYAAAQFSNFNSEIVINTEDINSFLTQMFNSQPKLEFYYGGYSDYSLGNRHTINFKYTNQNINIDNIHYTNTKEELTKIIANAMLYCKDKLYLVSPKDANIKEIIENISRDNQIVSMGYKGFSSSSIESKLTNNVCYEITFDYSIDRNLLLSYKKDTEYTAITILCQALCKSMPDYQKEKIIHDYIVEHTDYSDENGDIAYMPYDALINGKGVCSAYAGSVKIMLDYIGIENYYVSGKGTNSQGTENHAWNIVKLGENYYNLDTTWDDPIVLYGINDTKYDYFNITDSELSKDHQWDKSLYPECNGTEYDYITVRNLVNDDFNEYNDYYEKSDFQSVFDKYSLDEEEKIETSTIIQTEITSNTTDINNVLNYKSNNLFIYLIIGSIIIFIFFILI